MTTDRGAPHCRPLGPNDRLTTTDIERELSQLEGWALCEGAIEKRFEFDDFHRTMAFVNALAWIAHVEDHHPDVGFGYDHCTVRYRTHSVGGVSMNDFICAAKVDALLP
jgi:4a-hydroxytetrahydrobiopterin dehydratase